MAEVSDYPCSSSSEDDEYSDPLEVAASAGARLSTQEKASISRKRKVQTNPAKKKRNVRGSVDHNMSMWDRVNEFKDQCLTTVLGNLRYDACRETLSKIKSSVKKHVSSIKHIKALENIRKSKKIKISGIFLQKQTEEQKDPHYLNTWGSIDMSLWKLYWRQVFPF